MNDLNRPIPFSKLARIALRHRLLHRNGWRSPHHGFWSDEPGAGGALQRIVDAAGVLPGGGVIGGWAAAYLHGVAAFSGERWDGTPLDVMVCVPRRQQVRRQGIDDFRSELRPTDVTTLDGLPVTTLIRTAFDLTRRAANLTDAVCALDAIAPATDLSLGDLLQYADERTRWAGVRQVRHAIELADRRSLSPYETRMRMLWLLDAGLPPLECNRPLFSPDGELLGYPDLFERWSAVVLEYDGAHHRDAEQQSFDNIREERFERHGLIVVRAGVRDLFAEKERTIGRMRAAHRDGLARDRTRDRWVTTPPSWWTPSGWFRESA